MISDYRNSYTQDESSFVLWSLVTLSILAFLAYAANLAFYPGNLTDNPARPQITGIVVETYLPNKQ